MLLFTVGITLVNGCSGSTQFNGSGGAPVPPAKNQTGDQGQAGSGQAPSAVITQNANVPSNPNSETGSPSISSKPPLTSITAPATTTDAPVVTTITPAPIVPVVAPSVSNFSMPYALYQDGTYTSPAMTHQGFVSLPLGSKVDKYKVGSNYTIEGIFCMEAWPGRQTTEFHWGEGLHEIAPQVNDCQLYSFQLKGSGALTVSLVSNGVEVVGSAPQSGFYEMQQLMVEGIQRIVYPDGRVGF